MHHNYKTANAETTAIYNEEMASLHPKNSYSLVPEVSYRSHDKELPLSSVAPPSKETLFQGIRHHLRLSLWGLAMATASIMTGYEEVFVGAISGLPAFAQQYGELDPSTINDTNSKYVINPTWIALWAISHPLGASVGSGFGGWTLDKIGRRPTLAIATAWLLVTPFISFFSDNLSTTAARAGVYFFGKFLQGIGVGATITVLLAYTSEVLPPSIKSSILALHVPTTLLGNLIGSVAIKESSNKTGVNAYRIPMAGQWLLLIIPVLLLIFLPESPVWSIRQNRISQAKASCRKLQGPSKDPSDDMFTRLMELVAGQEESKMHMEVIKWSELFRTKSDRHRTFVVVFSAAIPLFLGVPFLTHAGYVGELMGMTAATANTFVVIGSVIGVLGSILAFVVIPAIGRRPNLLISSIIITVLWLSTGIAGCFLGKKGPPVHGILNSNDQAVTKYIASGVILVTLFLAVFAWPVTLAISGETSSLRLRAKTMALRGISENITSCIISIALPYLYSTQYANIPSKIGFIFFGLAILVIIISWLTIPETKGMDNREIDAVYEGKD